MMCYPILLFVSLWQNACPLSIAKSIHTRDSIPNYIYYHDDGLDLKSGQEITVFLSGKSLKNYYFNVEQENSLVRIVVTPCGGTIKWKLFQTQTDKFNAKNGVYGVSIEENTLLEEVGDQSLMEYNSGHNGAPAGVLRIEISATDAKDVWARIFAAAIVNNQESPINESFDFFPTLPRKKRLVLESVSETSVAFSWDASPDSETAWKVPLNGIPSSVKYCIVLSQVKRYSTFCEFGMELNGGLNKEGNKLSPTVVCAVDVTKYDFKYLIPNTKYHLSLFAVNSLTGGSSAYDPASFVTRSENFKTNVAVQMMDGQMYASYLNPAKTSFQLYEFSVKEFRPEVILVIQPCTGYIRVNLFKDEVVLRKSIFDDLKTFVVNNVDPGIIRINITNDDGDAKLYKIWATTWSSRNPYPKLPSDTSLKALESGRTCRSIELAWLTAEQNQSNYCLYKREEKEEYFKQLILEQTDQCKGPTNASSLVFCKMFPLEQPPGNNARADNIHSVQSLSKSENVMMTVVVGNLKPSTTYRFDLYVSKNNGQHLPYRTIWAKTKPTCEEI